METEEPIERGLSERDMEKVKKMRVAADLVTQPCAICLNEFALGNNYAKLGPSFII